LKSCREALKLQEKTKPSRDETPNLKPYEEVEVTWIGDVAKNPNTSHLGGSAQPGHPWLSYIKDFTMKVPDIPLEATDVDKSRLQNVRIALIDDGTDYLSDDMENWQHRFDRGRSFDTSEDGPAPYFSSTSGHGTLMAKLILHVCRFATIIPYRLMSLPDRKTYLPRPVPFSAAKVRKECGKGKYHNHLSLTWTSCLGYQRSD
jgi:hypothetical protein